MKRLVVLAAAAVLLIATPVTAKEGLYIGAYLVPSSDISGVPGVESGSGYGFRAGVGFNRYFSVEGSLEFTEQDTVGGRTADVNGLAVDAKINFPLTSLDSRNVMTVEPYVRLGYGLDYEIEYAGSASGSGSRIGVGIELYLFQELSINAGWTNTNVSFDGIVNRDGDVRVFDVGLNYHFM